MRFQRGPSTGSGAPSLPTVLAALFAFATLASCADEGLDGVPLPNAAPETNITAMPPLLDAAGSSVSFAWSGFDPDGSIVRYQWRISDNGADNRLDPQDTLLVAWRTTSAGDSLFEVSAVLDSFPPDVGDPRQHPWDYRAWQTHTFFVRAVDNRGAVDPTPAHVSFTATTLAPTIVIDVPTRITNNSCTQSTTALRFGWTAADPDGPLGELSPPDSVRTLWWPVPECTTETRFERENPLAAAPESAWSPWVAYDAAGDAGRLVTLPVQPQNVVAFFAVQAKDRAGAVTPTFEWGVNVRHVETRISKRPLLSVSEKFLGDFTFSSSAGLQSFDIVPGQPLEFQMVATADSYSAVIDGYRYGWDVADINDPNDPGWSGPWGEYRRSDMRSFSNGVHNFVVQTRDLAGTVVRGIFVLSVMEPPPRSRQRSVLFLEDWPHAGTPNELAFEQHRDEQWRQLLEGLVEGFEVDLDAVDLGDEPGEFSLLRFLEYRSVVYFNRGSNRNTQLHAFLAPVRVGTVTIARYNWLEVYQAFMGNVMIVGPGSLLGSLESNPPTWRFPIVFNWPDDFGEHQEPDGTLVRNGLSRFPYSAFCIESVDMARPNGQIYGEPGSPPLNTAACDGLIRALVGADFLAEYPSAQGQLVDLEPTAERIDLTQAGMTGLGSEEFYNLDRSARRLDIHPRPCQKAMFRWRARRDEGYVANPDSACAPLGLSQSPLEGAACAIASAAYSSSKPVTGAPDIVWGFYPLTFAPQNVRSALQWIVRDAWQLQAP